MSAFSFAENINDNSLDAKRAFALLAPFAVEKMNRKVRKGRKDSQTTNNSHENRTTL